MDTQEYKAFWCSVMDSDAEMEFYGSGGPFFGTYEELEEYILKEEPILSNEYECNVNIIFSEYSLDDIASDIMKQRLYYLYSLPEGYDSLDIASDLFHMYDMWVDTDFCLKIKPHLQKLMEEKRQKREAELTARYGGIPSRCDKYGQITL